MSPRPWPSSADGVGDVLVDEDGSALYPPEATLFVSRLRVGPHRPTGSDGLGDSLGVATRPDGSRQVTFDGRLLYSFVEDSGPGVVTGNGFSDTFGDQPFTWHVATPTGVSTSSVNSSESDDGGLYGP